MNQIITTPQAAPLATLPPSFVPASGRLGATISAARHGSSIWPLAPQTEQEAWSHLHALQPLLAPAAETQMLAWLRKLAPAVVNAPTDPREIQAKAAAIWDLCGDFPCAVWCDETRRSWLRTQPQGKFWPAAGELFTHLEAFAAALSNDRAGCEKILAAGSARQEDAPAPKEDPLERQAVTDLMRAWRGEQKARQTAEAIAAEKSRPIAKATPVNDELLLAIHEDAARNGNALSGIRAKFLRQKMGLPEMEAAHAAQ